MCEQSSICDSSVNLTVVALEAGFGGAVVVDLGACAIPARRGWSRSRRLGEWPSALRICEPTAPVTVGRSRTHHGQLNALTLFFDDGLEPR